MNDDDFFDFDDDDDEDFLELSDDVLDHHHAARNSDPVSSHKAMNRVPRWDSQNARALRVMRQYDRPEGLTYWEVQRLAEQRWGPGALGRSSPWKRVSELKKEWDPPLIAAVFKDGQPLMRIGGYRSEVIAYRITSDGISMCARLDRPS